MKGESHLLLFLISYWNIHWSMHKLQQQMHTSADISTVKDDRSFNFLNTLPVANRSVRNINIYFQFSMVRAQARDARCILPMKKLFYMSWRQNSLVYCMTPATFDWGPFRQPGSWRDPINGQSVDRSQVSIWQTWRKGQCQVCEIVNRGGDFFTSYPHAGDILWSSFKI